MPFHHHPPLRRLKLPPTNKASWRSGMKWPGGMHWATSFYFSPFYFSYSHQTATKFCVCSNSHFFLIIAGFMKATNGICCHFSIHALPPIQAAQQRAPQAERTRIECDCVAPVYSTTLYIPPHLPTNPPVKKLTFCLSEGQSVLNGSVDDRLQLPVPESGAAVQVFFFSALAALAVSPESLMGYVWTQCPLWNLGLLILAAWGTAGVTFLPWKSATSVILVLFDQLQSWKGWKKKKYCRRKNK